MHVIGCKRGKGAAPTEAGSDDEAKVEQGEGEVALGGHVRVVQPVEQQRRRHHEEREQRACAARARTVVFV